MSSIKNKVFDDLKEYDKAFEQVTRANKLKRETLSFDGVAFENYISRTIEIFSKEFIEQTNDFANLTEQVVFIVGMPRTGSSLIEQILSAHSNVWPAGETGYLEQVMHRVLNDSALTFRFHVGVHRG